MRILTKEQAAQIDRCANTDFGISGLVLMENAGRGASDLLCALQVSSPIVVCCGKGNNAGDGYVIARHLLARSFEVTVLNWENAEKIQGDARTNYEILRAMKVEIVEHAAREESAAHRLLAGAAWIVDALLGTGTSGPPRPPIDRAINAINHAPAETLAVDIPSGLDCNTGAVPGVAVRANHTCTFAAPKVGLLTGEGPKHSGNVHVVDLGIPPEVIRRAIAQNDVDSDDS